MNKVTFYENQRVEYRDFRDMQNLIEEYVGMLVDGTCGSKAILTGLYPTITATNTQLLVTAGYFALNGVVVEVGTNQTVPVLGSGGLTASTSYNKWAVLVAEYTSVPTTSESRWFIDTGVQPPEPSQRTVKVRSTDKFSLRLIAGTASASPAMPTIPATAVPLVAILIRKSASTLLPSDLNFSIRALDARISVASQAEAQAGVDDLKFMSPLKTKQALTANTANTTEAQAGTNDVKFMTPLKTKQAIGSIAPKAHSHAIANLPVATSGTSSTTQLVRADDSRLSNARTPVSHNNTYHSEAYALQARTITAGKGLSGGGSLASNRTITLGTPGTITGATTNAVTTSSHTHALTVDWGDIANKPETTTASPHKHAWADLTNPPATYAPSAHGHGWTEITGKPASYTPSTHTHSNLSVVAGNGMSGGGALSASRTLTLGTPGTITGATTNAVTKTSHTHALTVNWADVGSKPTAFTPATHTHAWTTITGKPSSFTPTAHGHAWSEITDPPASYAPSAHSHGWTTITGKPTSFAPTTHGHAWSEISGTPSAYNPSTHTHSNISVSVGDGLTGGGDLSTSRTISMGTPTSLSGVTTNRVDGTTHAHSLAIAAKSQAQAGTDSTTLMTPLRTKQAIDALVSKLIVYQ